MTDITFDGYRWVGKESAWFTSIDGKKTEKSVKSGDVRFIRGRLFHCRWATRYVTFDFGLEGLYWAPVEAKDTALEAAADMKKFKDAL